MTKILINSMRLVDPFKIEEYDLTPWELIRPLGKLCRYSGQTAHFYSVAEHSVHLSDNVPDHLKRAAALHDLNEGLTNDLPRPLKQALPDYMKFEEHVQRHIFNLFDEPWENMEALAEYDYRICQDEMSQLFDEPWSIGVEPLGVTVQCWRPDVAELRLRETFVNLGLVKQ